MFDLYDLVFCPQSLQNICYIEQKSTSSTTSCSFNLIFINIHICFTLSLQPLCISLCLNRASQKIMHRTKQQENKESSKTEVIERRIENVHLVAGSHSRVMIYWRALHWHWHHSVGTHGQEWRTVIDVHAHRDVVQHTVVVGLLGDVLFLCDLGWLNFHTFFSFLSSLSFQWGISSAPSLLLIRLFVHLHHFHLFDFRQVFPNELKVIIGLLLIVLFSKALNYEGVSIFQRIFCSPAEHTGNFSPLLRSPARINVLH